MVFCLIEKGEWASMLLSEVYIQDQRKTVEDIETKGFVFGSRCTAADEVRIEDTVLKPSCI